MGISLTLTHFWRLSTGLTASRYRDNQSFSVLLLPSAPCLITHRDSEPQTIPSHYCRQSPGLTSRRDSVALAVSAPLLLSVLLLRNPLESPKLVVRPGTEGGVKEKMQNVVWEIYSLAFSTYYNDIVLWRQDNFYFPYAIQRECLKSMCEFLTQLLVIIYFLFYWEKLYQSMRLKLCWKIISNLKILGKLSFEHSSD